MQELLHWLSFVKQISFSFILLANCFSCCLPQDTSGTLYQLQINLVSGCCALLAMEICRCCGSALQLDLIVPSHLLDHLHGTVPMHLRSVGLDLVQRTILKCLRTACFSPSDSF